MRLGEICRRPVDLIEANRTVKEAALRMRQRGVGTLVVVTRQEEPVGLVTDRDLALRVVARGLDAAATPVSEVMTSDPRTIREDATLEEALTLLQEGPYRRLPVVDARGRLVGILSLDDALLHLVGEMKKVGEVVQAQTPAGAAI